MSSPRRSLLAEMALRFVGQRELLATTSLGYILGASAIARDALGAWLMERGVVVPDNLVYGTEISNADEKGRPDVVGTMGQQRHVILEGKFWASLTSNQPVNYLQNLADGGCLLVVAPELRFEPLAAEIIQRCDRADLTVVDPRAVMQGGVSPVASGRFLGMVSWRALLGLLRASLIDHGDAGLAADTEQLLGLSELEDQDAFLPVTATDLATPTPQRVRQFQELPDAVCRRGISAGVLSKGIGYTWGCGVYGRYVKAEPIQLAIYVDLRRWASQRMTPLWVEAAIDPGAALADLAATTPPGVFFDGYLGRPVIPLEVPLHVERDQVLDDLVQQIREFLHLIEHCTPTA